MLIREIAARGGVDKPHGAYIYCLIDPRDGGIFYIGKSSQAPGVRLAGHLADGRKSIGHKGRRIRAILEASEKPLLRVLEDGLSEWAWGSAEKKWVDMAEGEGECLLNSATAGGGASRGMRRITKPEPEPVVLEGTPWERHLYDFLHA